MSAIHAAFPFANPGNPGHPPTFNSPAPAGIPGGIFVPGTKVQVGNLRVVIERYLSEGGFAHVYVVRLPKPIGGEDVAVLKRVAVPDKETLANMRTEVETMKRLRGQRYIVTYFDSHASSLRNGGYEVFLLMEFCDGGGLIDFMNTRLQNRLTEPEILKIFSDTAQGVACMHYLKPPLLHRDLKVENILISSHGGTKTFKLCDFGSSAPPRPAARSVAEGRLIEEDVQKHTTMQYRSPEMIDVYRKQTIDEKSDIWALGVLLYKLCYYTTPFEEQGQMAILNANFQYPGYPRFSDKLKMLIASMLRENPAERPNIYQVLKQVSSMRGMEVPIKDIYANRTASEVRRNQELPPRPDEVKSPLPVGAYRSQPVQEKQAIPDIAPMRRGRPRAEGAATSAPRPSPSPLRVIDGDPFAALDSKRLSQIEPAKDELSDKFPSLEHFSLLHAGGEDYSFGAKAPDAASNQNTLNERVTNALADEAFASVTGPSHKLTHSKSVPSNVGEAGTSAQTASSGKEIAATAQQKEGRVQMVSTGTMTSPEEPKPEKMSLLPSIKANIPPSQSQRPPPMADGPQSGNKETPTAVVRSYVPQKSSSVHGSQARPSRPLLPHSSSSRPSLETRRSDTETESSLRNEPMGRLQPPAARPLSTLTPSSQTIERNNPIFQADSATQNDFQEAPITSDVDFLKSMEEDTSSKKREKRNSSSSKSGKRSSLPSISLSGTKNLLSGRFGEAFKKFESGNAASDGAEKILDKSNEALTPIAGSEIGDSQDRDESIDESQEIPPEMRRELERRRLELEERRVEQAAAEHRARVQLGQDGRSRPEGAVRAALIQNRVQFLLSDSAQISPKRTAEGYGRFTNSPKPSEAKENSDSDSSLKSPTRRAPPKTVSQSLSPKIQPIPPRIDSRSVPFSSPVGAQLQNSATLPRRQAPSAPPKPQGLRNMAGVASTQDMDIRKQSLDPAQAQGDVGENWEAEFTKKYPSLAKLEMVEMKLDK